MLLDGNGGNLMKRTWTGLSRRFSEASITKIVMGATVLAGMLGAVPIVLTTSSSGAGATPFIWLIISFCTSLLLGWFISKPILRLHRSRRTVLTLNDNRLNVRWPLSGKEIELDLTQPVDIQTTWCDDGSRTAGRMQADVQQNGTTVTFSTLTSQTPVMFQRIHANSAQREQIILHPSHLRELLEVVRFGSKALQTPFDAQVL